MEPCHNCGQPTWPERTGRNWDALCTSCGRVAWIAPGEILRVPVTKLADFGAFVEIGDGLRALIHINELSDIRIEHPADVVSAGDVIDAIVLCVDGDQRKAALSVKWMPGRD